MNVPTGKQLHDLSEHVLEKRERLLRRAQHARISAPLAGEVRIRTSSCTGMTGDVDLGNDGDVALTRVGDEFANVGLRVVRAAATGGRARTDIG